MTARDVCNGPQWHLATGLERCRGASGPRGALVPDGRLEDDRIAVVYDRGQKPRITVEAICATVHKVLADGIAVAVVARASGQAPREDDVLLIERFV